MKHLPTYLILLCGMYCYGQKDHTPKSPTASFPANNIHIGKGNIPKPYTVNNHYQNQILINGNKTFNSYEQDRMRVEQELREKESLKRDIQLQLLNTLDLSLPSKATTQQAKYYKKAFEKLLKTNIDSFSIKDATFTVESAFYDNQRDFEEFNKTVKRTGAFLREKMKDFNYDPNSNLAKNLILFQFFADTLEIKSKGLKHLPLRYDFNDYKGKKNWRNMFVSKLLTTGKGQCHSLPLLYLILADEIKAKAHLSLSPNHTYIKFQDNKKKWYNVELTNGMFTTDTYILQSGYITSEALQNGIYMQELTNKQLLSQSLNDLAMGYISKFGYDNFVKQIIDKALELHPNNINSNILLENYLTYQFEYVTRNLLGINPRNKQELQQIRKFPNVVNLLNKVNLAQQRTDNLGYKPMPSKMYQNWLNSLKQHKQQQEDKELKERFKLNIKTLKN
ncbi:hypothetical protein [Tenacibaculum amylolyticum]|uniref:hypothetical protein n=1 Tax=Tenacibaculum amylolyticum TaxID=104269 RepID=UPI003896744C